MSESKIKDTQQRCPLCGELNCCEVAKGKPIEKCWCNGQNIPHGLLMKLPAEQRGKACVCRACIEAYNQDSN